MDMRTSRFLGCGGGYMDLHPMTMTSPTCEDLGIPAAELAGDDSGGMFSPFIPRRIIQNPGLHFEGLRWEAERRRSNSDPYSPLCMIPLPGALTIHTSTEPSFIRKRNERERERVRCVNDGYERLKEHLPSVSKEKRISKVETLRGAIEYIRELRKILEEAPPVPSDKDDNSPCSSSNQDENENENETNSETSETTPVKNLAAGPAAVDVERESRRERVPKRRCSLSSEQSVLSDGTLSESDDERHFLSKKPRLH